MRGTGADGLQPASWLLHEFGTSDAAQQNVWRPRSGAASCWAGTAAMVLRYWLDRRSGQQRTATVSQLRVRPLPTVAIGVAGGLVVGMTSVGSVTR